MDIVLYRKEHAVGIEYLSGEAAGCTVQENAGDTEARKARGRRFSNKRKS